MPRTVALASTPSKLTAEAAASPGDGTLVFERWLIERSSLRGSELDGDWGILDSKGQLVPSHAVRRRFDQLLTLQGEVVLAHISAFVERSAHQALGHAGGAQVVALWRRYLELLAQRPSVQMELSDASSWPLALAERHSARRALLGPAWAEAFYAQEEAELQALIGRAERSLAKLSSDTVDEPALPVEAQQRLAAARRAWTDWEDRLAQARVEWARLKAQAQLSDTARVAEVESWFGPRFDAQERRRVRALLGIPPASP